MNRQSFLSLITKLINEEEKKPSNEGLEKIIDLFKNYLALHPQDSQILLKFALLFLQLPKDEDNALDCLQKILEYDPENIIAKILLACFADYFSYIDKSIFEILCNIKTTNRKFLSIIEFEKSRYYYHANQKFYKESLIKSIDYCDDFVMNYKHLGLQYLYEEKDIKNARFCFQKALNNIQYVYTLKDDHDPLNVEEFIDERLKGIYITEPNLESLQSLLESCS